LLRLSLFVKIRTMVERAELQQEPNPDPADRGFDPIERSFEDRLLQSELISSRQVTLREVLKTKSKDGVDPANGVLDIFLNFQVRDDGDSLIHIASFPQDEIAFGGERLLSLLERAKPVRIGVGVLEQDWRGIVDDWRILQELSRENSNLFGLYARHSAEKSIVKEKFMEFGQNHFKAFWEAMHATVEHASFQGLKFAYNAVMSEDKALTIYGLGY